MQIIKSYKLSVCCLLLAACNPQTKTGSSKPADAVFTTQKSDSTSKGSVKTLEKDTVSAAALIVPGKSIGKILLKEDSKKVYDMLGKPDSGDAAMGRSLSTWYADHDKNGYATQVFCTRNMGNPDELTSRVKQIRVTSPYFKTKEGIGAGSTFNEIDAVFTVKKSVSYPKKNPPYSIYDTGKGIAFEIDQHKKCMAVIVYLPGDKGGITYLSFHS